MDPGGTPPEAVVIDSLLNVDQYCASDKSASSVSDGKAGRDIAEVAAATELLLPKGSFRTTSSVKQTEMRKCVSTCRHIDMLCLVLFFLIRPAARLRSCYTAVCGSISKLAWTG